jgi:predicted solute-binding protein
MSDQLKITAWQFDKLADLPRKEMKTYYDKVRYVFDKYPETREDDLKLIRRVHDEYGKQSTDIDKTFIAVAFALRKHENR